MSEREKSENARRLGRLACIEGVPLEANPMRARDSRLAWQEAWLAEEKREADYRRILQGRRRPDRARLRRLREERDKGSDWVENSQRRDNYALAAMDALPALLDELDAAEKERDALRILAREALLFASTNGMHDAFWKAVDLVGGNELIRGWPFHSAHLMLTTRRKNEQP